MAGNGQEVTEALSWHLALGNEENKEKTESLQFEWST
jgi:hypothetical protein